MLFVSKIYDDAAEILGMCDQAKVFKRLDDAVELLANKGDFDPLLGCVDICTSGCYVTLPREVETVIALNIGNHPAFGRDQLFSFHLNGPGEDCPNTCDYSWDDLGDVVTYRELSEPSKLVASIASAEDEGKEVWAFGYDQNQQWIRTKINGEWREGYLLPTIFGYPIPAVDAPYFSRIERIQKEETVGPVRVSSFDASSNSGTLIGIYEWDEVLPTYRRLKLSREVPWVRIFFRKRVFEIKSVRDFIPLHNRFALIMALMSLKFWRDGNATDALVYEANATRMITEEQFTRTPTTLSPMQVLDGNLLHDKNDEIR